MRRVMTTSLLLLLLTLVAMAAAKPKIVTFGRWLQVKWMVGASEDKTLEMKVRPLLVNGEAKLFITGEPHEITDRLFVVREAHRLNDMLPDEKSPKWRWQPGAWVMVNRSGARISKLALPEYDSFYSEAVWYRDFVAYCGVADNEKLYAMVVQVGRRKPVVKKLLGAARISDVPYSECATPVWLRQPMRVVFEPVGGEKVSFNVRGQNVEVPADPDEGSENP